MGADPAARIAGIHVYTFNELERTEALAGAADRPAGKRGGTTLTHVNEHPEILLYTRIRKSPYFYASRRHGVQMFSVYNHTYHPRHYGDPVEEYWQLLNGVTLWDVGVERQVEISGPDAFDFTNLLVARDLNKCQVEQCKYVFLCLPDGGIINDPVLLRVEENRFLLSLADSDIELWARGVAHNSDYDVTIKEVDVAPVQVQGPKSKDVMVSLFGNNILEIPYYFMRRFELDGMSVLVSRTGYTGELGYEIYLHDATKNAMRLWDAVLEAGKPHDLAVIGPCHIRRIEGGILALGADMWYDTNPYEVGMGYDWMVDLEQGAEFIGKEALARIKREGPKRKLVGVEIGGERLGAYNDGSMIDFFPVNTDGGRIGEVTSACFSPRLEKNIGFAMVPIELAQLGTELEVERPEGTTSAVVVEKPFIDPKKETPKQELSRSAGGQEP
jgi:aminomethyltransferase